MLEPPSQELVRQLTELQLCLPSDLKRARGRVRHLAFDLPAFDSVWIDSLVQLRLLTPYQAKQLEQGQAAQLRIGSFVAVDELGRSHRGTTLLARRLHRRDRCVVKRRRIESDRMAEVGRQMRLTLERANGFAHPLLVLPSEILPDHDNELVTVSRFVPGLPLNELLVRRGRFPAAVVFEIGRQLIEGLAALHARSLVHGDIRMSNVRLTDNGLAVLVDAGIRQAVHPEVTIHDTLALEAYDGIAPELIGTGAAPSASSEMYAVGCLLWQLLAGRPPYATADPLAKLAAHQMQSIDDVRVWAPDTPAMLAESIRQLTSPAPHERPRSFDEILQRWGRPGSYSRSRLRQFRRLFDGAVPHFAKPAEQQSVGYWVWTLFMVFALTGGVAVLYDKGMRTELLSVADKVQSAIRTVSSTPTNEAAANGRNPAELNAAGHGLGTRLPLPPPSKDGVILLTERGPYDAGSVTFSEHLVIRGAPGAKAEITIGDVPLSLAAPAVTLQQLTVRQLADAESGLFVKVYCQQLTVANCVFVTDRSERFDASVASRLACVASSPLDPNDASASQVTVENSAFQCDGTALFFAQAPRQIRFSNTLKSGSGPLVSMGSKCRAGDFRLMMERVTLRAAGPLLKLAGEFATQVGSLPVQIDVKDSVFEISQSRSAMVVLESEQMRADGAKAIAMTAQESVVTPGVVLLGTIDPAKSELREIDADEQFSGLVVAEVDFSGGLSSRLGDAKVARVRGPRHGDQFDLPGIVPNQIGPIARK